MMPLSRSATPSGGDPFGHDECGLWDAAYVLGSLSSTQRREFEAQMADCPMCRNAVSELTGMPALLSRLDRSEVAAIDQADGDAELLLPNGLLPSLLVKTNRLWRRTRITAWTAGVAAAALLATGVFIDAAGPAARSVSAASISARSMAQIGTNKLVSTVSLTGEQWGTVITMDCVCLAPLNASHDTLAMVVVGRDGSRTRVATWTANPGRTATPVGGISTRVDQIASVQVVYANDNKVLLQHSL